MDSNAIHRRLRFGVFTALSLLRLIAASPACNATCGANRVQFPYGFSAACEIRLNCTPAGDIIIGDFPVKRVTSDAVLVAVRPECDRPVRSLRRLFGRNYAPTSRSGILLRTCTDTIPACDLPEAMVEAHSEMVDCSGGGDDGGWPNNNISCYSEKNRDGFISYGNLAKANCGSLYSSILVDSFRGPAVSLEVDVVELGWWLHGDCDCSTNAYCVNIVSPVARKPGFRCHCREGFVGDGYRSGRGCRKVHYSACNNNSKEILGHCEGPVRLGVLIGGIAAGASIIACLCLICYFVRRTTPPAPDSSVNKLLSEASGSISIPFFAYREIERATHSFSDKQRLGTGAYGTVYVGKLHSDECVAIKRIKPRDFDSIDQVMNEIKLLSSMSHPNLVRLLGCSLEKGEQILIYEFMPNGTLSQHLQRERGTGLTWPVRLAIASETAQAIAHLHSEDPPIYHRDIKTSNILLDHELRSKVADFGLSRHGPTEMSHIYTAPQGTPGYLDPQYHQNFHLSDKSDVYSFGVVLMEIITALKAVDFSRKQNEVNLAALATEKIRQGCLDGIIDPFLKAQGDPCTLSSVCKVAELAFRCLAFDHNTRPSMAEVAVELEQLRLGLKVCETRMKREGLDMDRGLFALRTSDISAVETTGREKGNSPISVQDPWQSEQSSPSASSLLSSVLA